MSSISWFIKEKDNYIEKRQHNAGTYRKDEKIELVLQAWNNRWGVENKEDIISPVFSFRFDSFEDNALLSLFKVSIDDATNVPVVIKDNEAIAIVGKSLSGIANDGDEFAYENRNNYVNIKIEIDTKDKDIKENDLKRLYLELRPMS